MKRVIRIIEKGIDKFELWVKSIIYGKAYRQNKKIYIAMNKRPNFMYHRSLAKPCYTDRYHSAGRLGAYFWQDLWAAQHLCKDNVKKHYDIGSRIDGFIAHVSSFIPEVVLIDVRPLNKKIPNVTFECMDATVHDLEDYIEYDIDIHKYDEEYNDGLRFGLFEFVKR